MFPENYGKNYTLKVEMVESRALLLCNQTVSLFNACADYLVAFINYIQEGFIDNAIIIGVFLDIEGAFDNIIPSILVEDL